MKFQKLKNSSLEVRSWTPSEGVPPTQVHLLIGIPEIEGGIAVRLKTREGIDELIRVLQEYREDVFGSPTEDPDT